MESVHESAPAAKILVGVSLDARASSQLLSWAVTVAARPNDTVIALHVLGSFVLIDEGFHRPNLYWFVIPLFFFCSSSESREEAQVGEK